MYPTHEHTRIHPKKQRRFSASHVTSSADHDDVCNHLKEQKLKKSRDAIITSRSQPLTPRGREKKTDSNVCKINNQMHTKHIDQVSLSQA